MCVLSCFCAVTPGVSCCCCSCPAWASVPQFFYSGLSAEALSRMSSSPLVSRANMDILDELQLIAAQNLERLEVNKYYEVIRELGKGTYGKVDLVIHKIRGEGTRINIQTAITCCSKQVHSNTEVSEFILLPFRLKRYKNGPEVPEEEDNQAEVIPARVQHLTLPVSLPFHHQHVRHRLRDRRVLCVCTGVRSGWGPLRYHSSTGAPSRLLFWLSLLYIIAFGWRTFAIIHNASTSF